MLMTNKEREGFRLQGSDILVLSLLIFKFLMIAFLFPEFEMPDEYSHFIHIIGNEPTSTYFMAMHKVYVAIGRFFSFKEVPVPPVWNSNFRYASNSMVYGHNNFNCALEIIFKFAHLAVILIFIFSVFFILKKIKHITDRERKFIFRLHLLYLSWPAISFFVMGISSDFLTYLYMPLFFLLIVYYNKVLLTLVGSFILLRYVDNNAIFLVATAFFYLIANHLFRPGEKVFTVQRKAMLIALVFLVLGFYSILIKTNIIAKLFPIIGPHIKYNYAFGYQPIKSMGTCFLGLYYLGGMVSLTASWLEYIIFFIILVCLLKRVFIGKGLLENRFFLYLLSCFLTFHFILLTFPTIDQGRYYFFLIPALFTIFDFHFLKEDRFCSDKPYVILALLFFVSTMIKLFSAVTRAFLS